MRKLILSLLAVTVLGAGSAFAQSGFWAGASAGWPGAALHFGVENVVAGLDVRANVGASYTFADFSVGADVLYGLDLDDAIETYVGGGVALKIGTGIGFGAFAGFEYRLGEGDLPEGGIFVEVGPSFAVTPAFAFGVLARLGFNYHF
ncbi:MAG: hypothetical protein O3A02_03345 [bacterium]|jgi:hypothetical protein|nr:hypothetical protein [bacterium]